jgi:hypothetical protein
MKTLLKALRYDFDIKEILDFFIKTLDHVEKFFTDYSDSETNENVWVRARAQKKFELARRSNQKMNEIIEKVAQFDEKLQNIDKLIPMINELLLWNGNFKQVMNHFEINSHYLPMWGGQVESSLDSIEKILKQSLISLLNPIRASQANYLRLAFLKYKAGSIIFGMS